MSTNQFQLVVSKGPNPGQTYPLLTSSLTIGRDPMADIVFNDPEVSRQHCRLTQVEDGYQIQDLGSTNGTFLNGVRMGTDPVLLDDETEIALGSGVTLLFQLTEAALAQAASPDVTAVDDLNAIPDIHFPKPADEPAFDLPSASQFTAESPKVDPPAEMPAEPQPTPTPNPPLVPAGSGQSSKKRRTTLIVVSLILLLCCCCVLFLVSGYYWWGDLLLEWLGLI